jgi:hypothetical protein
MTTRRELLAMAGHAGAASVITLLAVRVNAQGVEYKATAVVDGGTISGRARLAGKSPDPDRIIIGKDNHICGEGHAAHDAIIVDGNGGLANAVVALKGIAAGRAWPRNLVPGITQEKCAFHPYVQVAAKDAELTIHNKDPLLHNIHAYELIGRARRTLFNIAQPQAGQIDKHKLELRRGNIVEIDCDAHNWMSAWVFISEHPYAVVTDQAGRFELTGIPPGAYELSAWHPVLGTAAAPVRVSRKTKTTADVAFSG